MKNWLDQYPNGGPAPKRVLIKDPETDKVYSYGVNSPEYRDIYNKLIVDEKVDPETGKKTLVGSTMEPLVFTEKRNKPQYHGEGDIKEDPNAKNSSWSYDRSNLKPEKVNFWDTFNFKNWGLNDYSNYSSFNSAFRNARESGEKEFMWNDNRYTTNLAPKEVSDAYFDAKRFLQDYYSTEPFFKLDTSSYGKSKLFNDYTQKKYGTTWLDYYNKIKNDPRYLNSLYNDPERMKIQDTLDLLDEPLYYSQFPEEVKNYSDQYIRNKYLDKLNDPSYYFSITSQPNPNNPILGYQDMKNKKFYVSNTNKGFNTTGVHELSHKGDSEDRLSYYTDSRVPKVNIDLINKFGTPITQDRFNYITDPTETEARKMSLLYFMNRVHNKNIKSGKITKADLDEIYDIYNSEGGYYGKGSIPGDVQDILELYSWQKDDLLKYLNNDFNYSKKLGGHISKYAIGGEENPLGDPPQKLLDVFNKYKNTYPSLKIGKVKGLPTTTGREIQNAGDLYSIYGFETIPHRERAKIYDDYYKSIGRKRTMPGALVNNPDPKKAWEAEQRLFLNVYMDDTGRIAAPFRSGKNNPTFEEFYVPRVAEVPKPNKPPQPVIEPPMKMDSRPITKLTGYTSPTTLNPVNLPETMRQEMSQLQDKTIDWEGTLKKYSGTYQGMEPIYQMTNNQEGVGNQKLMGFTYRDYYDPANPRIFRPKEFRFEKKLGGTTKPLTQYPWGGPAFDPKNINTAVQNKKYQEGIKWHEDWMNSPMYKKMLYSNLDTSAKYGENEEDLKNIDSVRRNNLEALKQKPLNVSSNLHELSNYNGVALPAAAWYDSRPKDITVFGTGYGNPTLMEHEIRHAIDDHPDPYLTLTNIPIKDVAYLSKNEPATYPSGRFNFMYPHDEKNFRDSWLKQKPYYTSPTEVNARLSQIRKEAQEKGIYDPFTQSAPDDFLNREDTRHISPLLDLKKYYSDDQIKYMLNNFSYNDKQKNNTGIYQSKLGGSAKWLDQYDDGGAPCPAGYVMNFAGQCVPIRNQALNEDAVRAYNTYTTSGAAQVMPSLTQDVNAYAREQEARAANERKMKEDAARAYNRNTDYNTAQVQAQTKQNLEKEKGYKEAKARAENTGTITTADPKVVESMEKEVDPSKRTAWDYAKFYGNVLMDPLNAMKYSNEHGGRDMPIDYFSQQDYNPSLMLSALTVGAGLGAGAGRGALGVGSKVLGALDNSSLLGRVSSLANTALTTPLTIGSKVFPNANLGNYFLGQGLFNSYKNLVGPAAGYESPLYKSWGEFGNNPSMSSLGNALGETGMTAFGLYGPKWGEGFGSMADDASMLRKYFPTSSPKISFRRPAANSSITGEAAGAAENTATGVSRSPLTAASEKTGFQTDPYYHFETFLKKREDILPHLKTDEGRRRIQNFINDNPHLQKYTVDDIINHFDKTSFEARVPYYRDRGQFDRHFEDQVNEYIRLGRLPETSSWEGVMKNPNSLLPDLNVDLQGNPLLYDVHPGNAYNFYRYGYHKPSVMSMGPNFSKYDAQHILEHEFAHLFQKSGPVRGVDDILSKITLRENPYDKSLMEKVSEKLSGLNPFRKSMFDKGYSTTNDTFGNNPSMFQQHKDYFSFGSDFMEKYPHAAEVRENLLLRGLLKNRYDEITPQMLKQHYNLYKNTEGDKYMLRLYEIMKNNNQNFKYLSEAMNNMPALLPYAVPAGIAAGAAYGTRNEGTPMQKRGGAIEGLKRYNDGGIITTTKKKDEVETSAEGYIDYLKGKGSNAYSIFAKGGSKGWLDNYK